MKKKNLGWSWQIIVKISCSRVLSQLRRRFGGRAFRSLMGFDSTPLYT